MRWNLQLIGCFEKGARAFFNGLPESACPYHSVKGFQGQRRDYWHQGYKSAQSGKSIVNAQGEIQDKR